MLEDNDMYANIQDENEAPEVVSLAGFEVTKAELFAHSREPALTVWSDKIKFNIKHSFTVLDVEYLKRGGRLNLS